MTDQCYSYKGVTPVVAPEAYVHPTAVLVGDVIIEAGVYVGPCAVLRGDFGRIHLHFGSNIQETCVVHAFPGKEVHVLEAGHVGHGAVLHGCTIGKNALIGMNSVVMDGAIIGTNSFVGALAFVKAGFSVPDNTLVAGTPAKVIRDLTEQEINWKTEGTQIYQALAHEASDGLQKVMPLTEIEKDRPKPDVPAYDPLLLRKLTS